MAAALAAQAAEHQTSLQQKDAALEIQRQETSALVAAKDKRIGLLERQLDTLAAQLNVDAKSVLSSEVLAVCGLLATLRTRAWLESFACAFLLYSWLSLSSFSASFLPMQVRAWLSEGGLGVYALMFHALGVDTLEDLLDAALVGDDELVLAGMDEADAAAFHTLRFRTAKRRRDAKVAAADAARLQAEESAAKAAAAAGRQAAGLPPLEEPLQPAASKGKKVSPPPLPDAEKEEEGEDEEDEVENEEGSEKDEEGEGDRGAAATAAADLAPMSTVPTPGEDDGDVDSVSSSEAELVMKAAKAADAKKAQTMEAFLCQLFFQPAEAATYAAVLAQLGCHAPADLHGVTQATLTHAGIKKFHARKICSAEIYRAFL
jgi:hypothetical protein